MDGGREWERKCWGKEYIGRNRKNEDVIGTKFERETETEREMEKWRLEMKEIGYNLWQE